MRRRASVAATLSAFLLLASQCLAEPFSGQSVDYGFAFAARGQENWCGDVVSIDLGIADNIKFSGDPYGLEKRLNRLMKIARQRCSAARRVEIRGWSGQAVVYSVSYAKSTNWAFIRKTTDTDAPQCPPDGRSDTCQHLVQGFVMMERMTEGSYFSDMQLTSYLNGTRSDVEWRDGNVVGRLTHLSPPEYQEAPNQLVDMLVSTLAVRCDDASGRPTVFNTKTSMNAALGGVNCNHGVDSEAHQVIIIRGPDYSWLLSVGSLSGDVAAARNWAERVFSRL